jgi:hypothetical protein
MIVTASSIPLAIILKNTINALSACLSVLTSLVGLIFIVSFIELFSNLFFNAFCWIASYSRFSWAVVFIVRVI